MLRDFARDARFLAALPFAVIGDLCGAWVARLDERFASALNPDEED